MKLDWGGQEEQKPNTVEREDWLLKDKGRREKTWGTEREGPMSSSHSQTPKTAVEPKISPGHLVLPYCNKYLGNFLVKQGDSNLLLPSAKHWTQTVEMQVVDWRDVFMPGFFQMLFLLIEESESAAWRTQKSSRILPGKQDSSSRMWKNSKDGGYQTETWSSPFPPPWVYILTFSSEGPYFFLCIE